MFGCADVEPDGAVETSFLEENNIGEFVFENLRLLFRFEIAKPLSPVADGFHYPRDGYFKVCFPFVRTHTAVKIFRYCYIDGVH